MAKSDAALLLQIANDEIACLRKLVGAAYREGWSTGCGAGLSKDVKTSSADWYRSTSKKKLEGLQ